MLVKGKYNEAKVFVDELDQDCYQQIKKLCNQPFLKDAKIRVMPDVHVGKGSTIGTTMTITNKVVPNLVGVDIGCGLIVVKIQDRVIDYKKLDKVIKENIPSGFSIRESNHVKGDNIDLSKLKCSHSVDLQRGYLSLGTLGGGNHFIEVNEGDHFQKYLVIHSGSRHLGLQVATYYQQTAQTYAKEHNIDVDQDLAYLEGTQMQDYLHDMKLIQQFASLNREIMADIIISKMKWTVIDVFQTIHNYIDINQMILRKGAISAMEDELFILPLNMRDGSYLCKGKGNSEWNYSAPHGAGRRMSRTQAKKQLRLSDYQSAMTGIYSSMVSHHTLDEAPMAYKDGSTILSQIGPTAKVVEKLRVLYNFKSK
ncbi:MAG TPA: RtcB family protein [Erysipelothrix sp.]|nr:RtcB family protein [Erysipelothrix sp.]